MKSRAEIKKQMKRGIRIPAVVLAFFLVAIALLAGCSSDKSAGGGAATATPPASGASADQNSGGSALADQNSGSGAETAASSDLAPYIDEMQQMADSMNSSMGDALKINITAEGNTLVMTYTITNADLGLTKDAIAKSMAGAEDTFVKYAKQMGGAGIANAAITIKWIGADGTELYNKTFK